MGFASFFRRLGRTKNISRDVLSDSQLSRCLGLVDLTAIGVGSTLGVGIYVLVGTVARDMAGPGVVLSFAIAAFVSLLSGLCYAEFGARIPITGSAYSYTYVAVGEFIAFVVGWSMLAECIVSAASVGKAWSQYFDILVNRSISTAIKHSIGTFDSDFLGEYPDLLALGMICVMTLVVIMGAKLSSMTMAVLTVINLSVVAICVGAGLFLVDFNNWSQEGGFLPYGVKGVLHGAATCFFAFVGFDVIATSSEESKNPTRDIPLSIMLTLLICFIVYTSSSLIITLIVPYYDIPIAASLAGVFTVRHFYFVKYVVSIGSLVALTAAMLGSLFPIPRIVYAMARDRLVFPFLAWVHPWTNVPVVACLSTGVFTILLATIFSLTQLVEMMSIGTLLSYLLVAMSVVLVRYQPDQIGLSEDDVIAMVQTVERSDGISGYIPFDSKDEQQQPESPQDPESETQRARGVVGGDESESLVKGSGPTQRTYQTVRNCTFTFAAVCFPFSALCTFAVSGAALPRDFNWCFMILLLVGCGCAVVLVGTVYLVGKQPQNPSEMSFKAPYVPYLPLLSIFCDVYLIMQLAFATWIRFAVWLFLGLIIYFGYGIWHANSTVEDVIPLNNDDQSATDDDKEK